MKKIKDSSESEMILEFLKTEYGSRRFNKRLTDSINKLNLSLDLITNGDINNKDENELRLKIMEDYREYPKGDIFVNFPKIDDWSLYELSSDDINNIYYVNYDYWNELSSNTSSPLEAVKNINNGIEIDGLSPQSFIDGTKYLDNKKFPPVVLITCNDKKYLILEGHSRMTIYGFNPSKLDGTCAFVGHCSEDEMKKYDIRMI